MAFRNVYNSAEGGTSRRPGVDIIQETVDFINKLLSIDNKEEQWEMFVDTNKQYLWNSDIMLEVDSYLKPCSLQICRGIPNAALAYERQGIALSTVLVNFLSILFFKYRGQSCFCSAFHETYNANFSSDDYQTMGVLGALRGKTEFAELLLKNGYISSLPQSSPLLKQETEDIMQHFIYNISSSAEKHMFEEVLNLLKNYFFPGLDREQIWKRLYFVACALYAVRCSLQNRHGFADKIINCLRMYFCATSDPYLSTFEVRCVLYSCFFLLNKLNLFDQYSQEFDKLMPESPHRTQPRKLTQLARCQVRQNLKVSQLPLRSAVEKLVLPKRLKKFVLCDVLDVAGNTENTSSQNAVTKSQLAAMLLNRPMF